MGGMVKIIRSIKENAGLSLLFGTFAAVATFPLIFKMGTAVYGRLYQTDLRGALWGLWWQKVALLQHLDYQACPFIGAPFGVSLDQHPVSWIATQVFAFVLRFCDPAACLNLLALLSFILTGIFTYHLVCYLTGSRLSGIMSGFIFAFAPYHLNKFMEFTFLFSSHWFVLYLLALLKLRTEFRFRYIVGALFGLSLTLAFNPYYAFFALIFTLGLFTFELFYRFRDRLSLFRDAVGRRSIQSDAVNFLKWTSSVAAVFLGAALLNFSSIYLVVKNLFLHQMNPAQQGSMGYVRSFDYLTSQSARLLSYFLPASTHPFFGGFTEKMFGSLFYGRGSIEQTLYLGWIPLILSFLAFRNWRFKREHSQEFINYKTSSENFYIGFFIFSAVTAFIFSMPPIVDIGLSKIYFPSYFTYKVFPMFRAYARFGMIVMLCISVLAGFGLKSILEKIRTRRNKILLAGLLFFGIIFEFSNIPPFRVTELNHVPKVYGWLASQPGDFIIAEYPMAKGSAGEAPSNSDYLYYQTFHQKRMVNGIPLGTPAYDIKLKILKIDGVQTPIILKKLGVKYVIVHSDLYKAGYHDAVDIIGDPPKMEKNISYRLIKNFGDISVYEISAEALSAIEKGPA